MRPQIFVLAFVLCACGGNSRNSGGPDWIHEPTRTVDNGYLVYVGKDFSQNSDRAQFKAEGLALEDLANECSFIPKGARIEDRYVDRGQRDDTVYVKVGVEYQFCEAAKKSTDPAEIKRLANPEMTAQLKRYQDFAETGLVAQNGPPQEIEPPEDIEPMPEVTGHYSGDTQFYMTRQYVAYQKEVVILAPANAYPPQAPQTLHFMHTIATPTQYLASQESANPTLKNSPRPWSKIMDRPHIDRPGALRSTAPHRSKVPNEIERFGAEHPQREKPQQNHQQQQRQRGRGKKRYKPEEEKEQQSHD